MFGALPALTEGWKDSLVGTALGEGVMEEYIEKVWQKHLRLNFLDDTFERGRSEDYTTGF